MGKLVKLLGSGVGLASEAIHAARSRSDQPSSSASASNTAPPEYVEVEDDTAEGLIRSGQAERVVNTGDEKRPSKAAEAGYDSEGDSSESEDLEALGQDEAAWELDDMAERVRLPTYDESEAIATAEPEDVKVKKEEAMVRELVRRAGTPPQPPRRIPCPVIIPQRRPRNKGRGFVRAYAPVLADCGISQEVFLQFLEDCDKASKVGSRVSSWSLKGRKAQSADRHLTGFSMDRSRLCSCWHCRLRPRSLSTDCEYRGASGGRNGTGIAVEISPQYLPGSRQSGLAHASRAIRHDYGIQRRGSRSTERAPVQTVQLDRQNAILQRET